MRALVRVAIAALVVLALALAALAFAVPQIIEGAELRSALDQRARERLGRSLEYGRAAIGILPPRLEVSEFVLGGVTADAPPAVRARTAALELAWRPLLSGRAVIDELEIEEAELRLVRTPDGIDLLAAAVAAAPAAPAEPEASGDAPPPVALRRVSLHSSRIVLDDRVASPPVVWRIDGTELVAMSEGPDAPVDFALSGRLESGGELRGQGRAERGGATLAQLELGEFSFAPLASYVDALDRLAGAGAVEVEVTRSADGALDLELAASGDALDVASADTTAVGALELTATLSQRDGVIEGPYRVDLTGAALDIAGGTVRKAAGEPGRLEGRVRIDDSGASSDFELQLRNLGGRGSLRTEPGLRLQLDAPAFELAGWEGALPALADVSPQGELAIEGLVYSSEPQRLDGRLVLSAVRLDPIGDAQPIELSGYVDALGTELALREMVATAGAAAVGLDGGLVDLFGDRALALRIATPEPIESNDVLSLFDGLRDSVYGPLSLDVDLGLPLSGAGAERPALERLSGSFSFELGGGEAGGRVEGVSLLRRAFDRFGTLGYAALLALPARRGESLEGYYSEEFREAGAGFRIADGLATTDDLRIVHSKYTAHLRGGLRLTDLTLDMTGEIEIGPELDALLAGAPVGRLKTIPLARVTGSLTDPKVTLRQEDVSRFVTAYALGADGELGRNVDRLIGEGASDLLRELLGGNEN